MRLTGRLLALAMTTCFVNLVYYSLWQWHVAENLRWAEKDAPPFSPATPRCALNFYGLPRALAAIVLPTIVENVFKPNKNYSCDVFVHYYALEYEPPSRSGYGGAIRLEDVNQLVSAAKTLLGNTLVMVNSTADDDFYQHYTDLLEQIRTVNNTDGSWRYRYWNDPRDVFSLEVHENILKMWHQQAAVWTMMQETARQYNVEYTRVAMLRIDVAYLTPIDIWSNGFGGGRDTDNRRAVLPAFQGAPVNDRLFFGPHDAVEIWAAKRLEFLEAYLDTLAAHKLGYGIHSERYLQRYLLPIIRQRGYQVVEDHDLCFARARADGTVWNSDCWTRQGPRMRNMHQSTLERMIGRQCQRGVQVHGGNERYLLDCRVRGNSTTLANGNTVM